MNTAALLSVALLLDAVLGEPAWLWSRIPHPAVLIGRVVGWFDLRLNHRAARHLKGLFAAGLLVVGAIGLGLAASRLGPVVEVIIAAVLLAQRSLVQHVQAVADALRLSTGDGRRAVAKIVSRDCRDLSEPEIARAAIESAAENLSDGVIAPAFWFLIGGLPGLIAYKAVNTADSMIGYRNDRYAAFGWASARLDDLLNLVPARLTAVLVTLLTGQCRAWSAIAADAPRHRSPNAGWPEAAVAYALGVALAGPRSYGGQRRELAWVNGSARKDIASGDIESAVALLWRVWAGFLFIVIAVACAQALLLG